MKPTIADGMLTGDAEGRVLRAFAPRWWQVWRWIVWLRMPAEQKTVQFVELTDEFGKVHRVSTRYEIVGTRTDFLRGIHIRRAFKRR